MKRMLIGWILTVLLLMGGGALAQEEHFSFILPDNENLASVAVGEAVSYTHLDVYKRQP